VSADGFVAHGLKPSAVIIDELHAWSTGKQLELFDALDTAVHKRPGGFWLVITTAGHDKSSLLGRLYSSMLESLELDEKPGFVVGRYEFNGVLMHWYGVPEDCDADDRKLWRAVNPASFVTTEALRKQRNSPSMSRATFARLHLNAWVAPDVERWIASDTWLGLAGNVEIPEGATVFIGADGSRAYDTTAIAWASKAPDGRIDVDARVFSVRGRRAPPRLPCGRNDRLRRRGGLPVGARLPLRRAGGPLRPALPRAWRYSPHACRARPWRPLSPTAARTARRSPRWNAPCSRARFATPATPPSRSRFSLLLAIVGTTATSDGSGSSTARARLPEI
jgi:Phage Terminase